MSSLAPDVYSCTYLDRPDTKLSGFKDLQREVQIDWMV